MLIRKIPCRKYTTPRRKQRFFFKTVTIRNQNNFSYESAQRLAQEMGEKIARDHVSNKYGNLASDEELMQMKNRLESMSPDKRMELVEEFAKANPELCNEFVSQAAKEFGPQMKEAQKNAHKQKPPSKEELYEQAEEALGGIFKDFQKMDPTGSFTGEKQFRKDIKEPCCTTFKDAAKNNHLKCLERIHNQASNPHGENLFHVAVVLKASNLLKKILNSNHANKINEVNSYGYTAIHTATLKGYPEITEFLIKSGADLTAVDCKGNSPLHHVCISNSLRDYITASDTNMDFNESDIFSPNSNRRKQQIEPKEQQSRLSIVKLIMNSLAKLGVENVSKFVNLKNRDGFTPLQYAICSNAPKIAEFLLNFGGNPDVQNSVGINSFHILSYGFCGELQLELMKTLYSVSKKGLTVKDGYGRLPIHIAASNSNTQLVDFMLGEKIDIESVDRDGNSLLLAAIIAENIPMTKHLIAAGAWADQHVEKTMWRPLHYAALRGDVELTRLLLNHGASPNAQTDEGQTPLLLTTITQAEEKTAATLALVLINHGANPNTPDVLGYAPLHRAAERGSLLLIGLFLNQGANVNARTGQGEYPFWFAFRQGNIPCMHAMLTFTGFDPENTTSDGIRPVHLVAEASGDNHQLMKMFILRGVNLNAKTIDGDTPLALAERAKNSQIVAMLKLAGAKK